MKTHSLSILFLTFSFFFSCNSTSSTKVIANEIAVDTLEQELPANFALDTIKKKHEIKEEKENLALIEKKYGTQWDFCQCVVKNDSIDKAVKNLVDFETPEAEQLMERFDFVSKKCQAFLGMDANKTPDERLKHEKKVKKCLQVVQQTK